jgi:hypothetical protein
MTRLQIEVLNVYWDSIPEKYHNHILRELPIGGYVRSLPFKNAVELPLVKVPVLGKIKPPTMIFNPSDVSVCETEVLTFRRVFARKDNEEPTYVWEKVK